MNKKRMLLILIIIVIFSLSYILISKYYVTSINNDVANIKNNKTPNDDIREEKNNNDKIDIEEQDKESLSTDIVDSDKKIIESEEKENIQSPESSDPQIENKEEPKKEIIDPPVNIEKEPTIEPSVPEEEIDQGYIEAMKEVEYLTEEECFDAGFKIAMEDTVNILGFDVRELYYGGKIIGYKLIIRYTNPLD